jgi:uncharacterized membrane protein YedE/YeeE
MKIVGAIAILLAVIFVWLAIAAFAAVGHMQNQVDNFNGIQKVSNELSGQARKNDAEIQGAAILGVLFGLGALLVGGTGVVFIVASIMGKSLFPDRVRAVRMR